MRLNIKTILLAVFLFQSVFAQAQKQIAITIDDVPNTKKFQQDLFKAKLLKKLDSMQLPVAIFINEGKIYATDSVSKNFQLLNDWAKRKYITLGNHTFSHPRYSDVGFDAFTSDSDKGESITRELAKKLGKPLKHFRFPFNDLGKDLLQRKEIENYLDKKGYQITPFTVESTDWAFDIAYEYYLAKGDKANAKIIGEKYVSKTIEIFDFFEAQSELQFHRQISQIYLCHDNSLNADYLPKIIRLLKAKKYTFISLDEALKDKVYQQKNNYQKKWGISWFYRWMTSQGEISRVMKKEPNNEEIEKLYPTLLKQ
ncbi:peptidoglycan/xylan/chitin deacetylase (PgdA/CDA1 family) [Flavobacterium endophyticum]|uniref:Peptidoglycan/xylan/chitin deacetylase (PgdA/CDA1 family) n=1 Tax=Flavobacterium endophyticum TaxID=1540163 RepID=A0A495M5L4_9FLAO|nr:polysaccharide deacetylase family protein [Flavobacterium endophyticum]RKS20480.1 peptidoglycan/xylan/chitin deacetylase (PgdA/CDA1 family) [Flavobacterium endophyticum]